MSISRNVFLSSLAVTAFDSLVIKIEYEDGPIRKYVLDIELGSPRSGHNFTLYNGSDNIKEVASWHNRIVGPTLPKVLEEIQRDLGLSARIRYKVDVFYDVFMEMCHSVILQGNEQDEDGEVEEGPAEVQPSYSDPVVHGLGTYGQI